ncbi:MAG: hypothetical protein J6K16_06960 [Alphaproteobacteria bacterium]|nr:hypothetical protein [Alphaproteobacteria bacterium]
MLATNKKYLIYEEKLMKEWDWEANRDLNPKEITCGSQKKVWWKCSLCGYHWETTISHRAKDGRCCPNCHHGRWSKIKRGLDTQINIEIAKDWHPIKNGKLTPDMFTKGSRYKAWWKCHICGKEIEKSIKNYNGCSHCKKENFLNKKNLAITNPQLLEEWNYQKNTNILPSQILASSPKKVWWKCKKCGYEWQAVISNRTRKSDKGCPCCMNRAIVKGKNDLATTHPELAKEWHPVKNGQLGPEDVTYGCGKKVWWLCPHGHEYQATVNHRTGNNATGCPICYSGRQTSFAEQAFYYYIKKIYPDTISRYKADFLGKMELDIFIPSVNIAIEYDGEAWHKNNKIHKEQKKYKICKKNNIYLIRLKEKNNSAIDNADECICIPDLYKYENLNIYIPYILHKLNVLISKFDNKRTNVFPSYDIDIKRDKAKILNEYITEYKKGSFGELYPGLAKEWHPTKNEKLTPYMFKPMSDHKVWWKCSQCGYEYEATIGHRAYGYGCMKCGIEKVTQIKRKAVHMIDPKTNKIVQTFISISDASRKMKISSGNIVAVCQGIRPKASGYIWRYADEEEATKYQKNKNQLEFNF